MQHLVAYAYYMLMSHFLLVWLLLLVLVVAGGLLLSRWADPASPTLSDQGDIGGGIKFLRQISRTDGISAIVLLLFVAFYIILIFYKEDFAYYDDEILTNFSVRGYAFPPPVWLGQGRFFPLADQEFNLLRFITRSPAGYHSLVVVELVILLAVLFAVFGAYQVRYRVLVLIAAMAAPSFVIPFTGFVYPERNVLFWLVVMLLCLQGYSQTKARIYFIGCLIATQFALYYKETVVLFVVAYAMTRFLVQLRVLPREGQRSWLEVAKENALSLGMLGLSAIYVVFFLAALLPHKNFSYITEMREPLGSILLAYLQTDWLAVILLAVVIVRFARLLLSSGQLDPMWDSLAAGALAYFFGVLSLRIYSSYYMAPVDFIALLYLARLSLIWLSRPTRVRVSVVAFVFLCVLLHDAAYSSLRIVERKAVITTKSEFADFLKSYLPTVNSSTVELFFPYANGFRLMELSAYLRYKGFQLVGQGVTVPEVGPRLVVEGREKFANNLCVEYRDYGCFHEESAGAGALIVVLPDDDASMSDMESIAKDSTLLLSLKAPGISTRQWFRLLHTVSPMFSRGQLPEHWLQLHVFKRPA
jgi:hypothetical protein